MPRTSTTRTRGVWERDPGSGIWWVRYRVNGILRREKVGRKSDALALYQKRKSEARAGAKLPENLRAAAVRFKTLAEEVLKFSEKHHRDRRTVESRLKQILQDFSERIADQIKPADIDAWLAQNTKICVLSFQRETEHAVLAGNPFWMVYAGEPQQFGPRNEYS